MKRIALLTLVFVASMMSLMGGCVASAPRWNAETRVAALHGPSQVTVPERYTYFGAMYASVVGEGDIVTMIPRDDFDTDVFVSEDSVMLVQRLVKLDRFYRFRYLGGVKTQAWDQAWRIGNYALDTTAPDSEFAQYLAFLKAHGVTLPKMVRVQILDKLSTDFIVVRVVTLLHDGPESSVEGLDPLPPFRKLYDQEQAREHSEPRVNIF